MCNLRLSKFNASFTHPSIGCVALDVVAFIPNPRVGFTNTLGPRPAWKLAENVVFNRFWGHIGRHVSRLGDCRKEKNTTYAIRSQQKKNVRIRNLWGFTRGVDHKTIVLKNTFKLCRDRCTL
jgi:hypothetical protein